MRVYFIGSPRIITRDKEMFQRIYLWMARRYRMLDRSVWEWTNQGVEDVYEKYRSDCASHFERFLVSVRKADIAVLEVTGHSFSMGYTVSKAIELYKPVVAMYQKGKMPRFMHGIMNNEKIQLVEYDEKNVLKKLEKAIQKAEKMVDVRFNFFIPGRFLSYLDWVSQKRMIPRAAFIRDLLEKEMKKDKFKG